MQVYGSRRGILDAVIMIGLAFIGIAAFLAIMNIFISVIAPTIPEILTDVPTLYDYDDAGNRMEGTYQSAIDSGQTTEQIATIQSQVSELESQMSEAVQNSNWSLYAELKSQKEVLNLELENLDFGLFTQPNQRLELYWMFAIPSLIILSFTVLFAFVAYYWEKAFSIFKKGTSIEILKTSVLGIVVILLLPEFWDTYAIMMKQFSLYLLDPFNGNPQITTARLWCKMGCIVDINELLNQDTWKIAFASPNNFGQELLTNAILPLFKAIPVAMLSISLFVIAKIRVLFIMIVLITIPIWMVCMNLPFLKKHANDMISNMIGASIAPIFSALTLFVGLSYIDSEPIPALEEWISVLGIGIFASVWPIILAPKLSVIASQTTSMVQTALQSSAMMGAMAGSGAASGMAASGALPGTNGLNMSKGQQFKTLLTSGMAGAGMVGASQITPMNIPGSSQKGVTDAVNSNLAEGNVNRQMAGIDATNPNLVDSQISNGLMSNPGNHVDRLHKMDTGKEFMKTPAYGERLDQDVSGFAGPQKEQARNMFDAKYQADPGGLV